MVLTKTKAIAIKDELEGFKKALLYVFNISTYCATYYCKRQTEFLPVGAKQKDLKGKSLERSSERENGRTAPNKVADQGRIGLTDGT